MDESSEFLTFNKYFSEVVRFLLKHQIFIEQSFRNRVAREFMKVGRNEFENAIDQMGVRKKERFIETSLKMGYLRSGKNGNYVFYNAGDAVCYLSRAVVDVIERG